MARRSTRVVFLALGLAILLGAAIGGLSQMTAVSAVDPRPSVPPETSPTPIPTATPTTEPTTSPSPSPTATPEAGGDVWVYTIAVGDSISELAIRFGTTTAELLTLNPEYADNQDLVEAGGTMIMPCTPIAAAEDRC